MCYLHIYKNKLTNSGMYFYFIMKTKKQVISVKQLDGSIDKLLIIVQSKNGYILTVPHSGHHITILDEKGIISGHLTPQPVGDRTHLGKFGKNDVHSNLLKESFDFRLLLQEEYSHIVAYFTQKYLDLLDKAELVIKEIETKSEILMLLDLPSTYEKVREVAFNLVTNPEDYFGVCPARELLTHKDRVAGILDGEKFLCVISNDNELIEFNFSAFVNLEEKTPLSYILEPMGLSILLKDLKEKINF